jgi:hypothetical protein
LLAVLAVLAVLVVPVAFTDVDDVARKFARKFKRQGMNTAA